MNALTIWTSHIVACVFILFCFLLIVIVKGAFAQKWVFVVVYNFPARVFRPNVATSNTWQFKQTLSNPGWRVMHTVRSPMASSMTSSQRSISLQQMHSCAFVTRLTEQFEHEHLQNNVKNSSNTRKIRLYKIINCLTSSIKLSHKIRTTANHIATKL